MKMFHIMGLTQQENYTKLTPRGHNNRCAGISEEYCHHLMKNVIWEGGSAVLNSLTWKSTPFGCVLPSPHRWGMNKVVLTIYKGSETLVVRGQICFPECPFRCLDHFFLSIWPKKILLCLPSLEYGTLRYAQMDEGGARLEDGERIRRKERIYEGGDRWKERLIGPLWWGVCPLRIWGEGRMPMGSSSSFSSAARGSQFLHFSHI